MMYTSYFAKLNKLPNNFIPISICGKSPDWYSGLEYKNFAPKYDFFMEWKLTHDNNYYIKCFGEQVLGNLNITRVLNELQYMLPSDIKTDMQSPIWVNESYHIVLMCYEKPTDFCHRHLVTEWLNKNGYTCEEYKF